MTTIDPLVAKHPDAFNRDPLLAARVLALCRKHGIRTVIETGCYNGRTTAFLAELPGIVRVHTCDVDRRYTAITTVHLRNQGPATTGRVTVHLGKSWEMLAAVLGGAEAPLLLFLDAHWHSPTPTPLELRAIAAAGLRPACIIIHDVQVPGHPELGYDSYADWTYDWAHLQPLVEAIYGAAYRHGFNDDGAAGSMRGCLFIERADPAPVPAPTPAPDPLPEPTTVSSPLPVDLEPAPLPSLPPADVEAEMPLPTGATATPPDTTEPIAGSVASHDSPQLESQPTPTTTWQATPMPDAAVGPAEQPQPQQNSPTHVSRRRHRH